MDLNTILLTWFIECEAEYDKMLEFSLWLTTHCSEY